MRTTVGGVQPAVGFGNWPRQIRLASDLTESGTKLRSRVLHLKVAVVIFIDGFDDKANTIGVKGLGELGICGSAAAVANAVFNATGARIREFPITIDRLLPLLSDSGSG